MVTFASGDLSKPTQPTPASSHPRIHPFMTSIDQTLFVFGGWTKKTGYLPSIEAYSPLTIKWEQAGRMPVYKEVYLHAHISKIYIFGHKLDESSLFSAFRPEKQEVDGENGSEKVQCFEHQRGFPGKHCSFRR